jgi:hypothetical protein
MADENLKFIQMKNGEGTNVFPVTKVKAVEGLTTTLEDLQQQISNAVAGGVTDVKVNGTSVVENNVANIPQILSSTEIQGMIDATVGQQIHMNVEVVETLPAEGVKGIIYLKADGKISGNYVEYIWTGSAFEQIGTTETDLTNYAKVEDLNKLDARVVAVEGKVATWDGYAGQISAIDGRVTTLEGKVTTLEGKVTTLEGEMDAVEGRLDVVEPKVEQNIKDIAKNAADIKTINESAVMTSGITAELVGKITANEGAFANYYTKDEADAKFETIENVNAVKEDVAKNAADIKTINESAVMTSGITADLVGKITANEANFANYFTKAELANVLYYEEVALD